MIFGFLLFPDLEELDLALAFIAHEAGEGTAGSVQSFAEYYPSGKNYGTFHRDPKAPGYLTGEP